MKVKHDVSIVSRFHLRISHSHLTVKFGIKLVPLLAGAAGGRGGEQGGAGQAAGGGHEGRRGPQAGGGGQEGGRQAATGQWGGNSNDSDSCELGHL